MIAQLSIFSNHLLGYLKSRRRANKTELKIYYEYVRRWDINNISVSSHTSRNEKKFTFTCPLASVVIIMNSANNINVSSSIKKLFQPLSAAPSGSKFQISPQEWTVVCKTNSEIENSREHNTQEWPGLGTCFSSTRCSSTGCVIFI